jgi:hypothetical protein
MRGLDGYRWVACYSSTLGLNTDIPQKSYKDDISKGKAYSFSLARQKISKNRIKYKTTKLRSSLLVFATPSFPVTYTNSATKRED